MILSQIPKSIQRTLFRRIDALNREGKYDPLETISNIPDAAVSEMLTKAVWVTATSSVLDYTDEGKLANKELLQISSAYRNQQPINRPLTSTVNLFTSDPSAIFRGHSGITSVTTDFRKESMQYVTINWTLNDPEKIVKNPNNKEEETNFEKYRNAFMKHGVYVQVEFGWSTPNIESGLSSITAEDMSSLFTAQKKQMIERGGNYYVASGRIVDFSFSIGPNGEYKCTTKLVSMANDIFSGQIENDSDKRPVKLKFDPNQQDIEASYRESSVYFESYMKSLDDQIKLEFDKLGDDALDNGIYHDGERGYCNWGWFEDNVLNTFFSFEGVMVENTDEGGNPKVLTTEIRSLVSKIKEVIEGDSVRVEEEPELKSGLCRNNKNLKTLDLHVVLPGQIDNVSDINKIVIEPEFGPSEFDTPILNKYERVYNTFTNLNNMPKFAHTHKSGFIRNIVFSSDFLKSTFGSGVSDLRAALNNHWSSVSSKYGSFWNFVVQSNVDKPHILECTESKNPGGVSVQDANVFLEQANASTRDNLDGTFVFSVYSKDSLMKDFSLDVRMTSNMSTMAALHTNKNVDKEGDYESPNPERDSMVAFGYLSQAKADELNEKENKKDKVLPEMKYPFQTGFKTFTKGADFVKGVFKPLALEKFTEKAKKLMVSPDGSKENIEDYIRELDTIETTEKKIAELTDNGLNYKYPTEGEDVLMYDTDGNMLDVFRKVLLNRLTMIDEEGESSYDPIIPISVTFTIPGIGGLMPFNIFQVDYLPEVYRKYAVFQIKNVSHNVTPQGWSTTITSIMRIDMNTLLKDTRVVPQEEKSKLKEFKSLDYVLASLKLQNMKKAENDDVEDVTADEDSPGPGT